MSTLIQPVFRNQSIFYLLSHFFQTMGYYGVRASIIVYLLDGFDFKQETVFEFYSASVLLVYAARLIGGVAGDVLLKSKWATVVGSFLQAIGVVLLCLPNTVLLIVGSGLIIIGNGLFVPNCLAGIGRIYHHHSKGLDAVFTLFLLASSVGAAITITLSDLDFGAVPMFIMCAVFFVLSGVSSLVSSSTEVKEVDAQQGIKFGRKAFLVCSGILIFGGFWFGHELLEFAKSYLLLDKMAGVASEISTSSYRTNQVIGIFFMIVFAIGWLFVSMRRWLKVAIGAFLCFLAFSLMPIALSANQDMALALIMSMMVLIGIAEALVIPTLYALVSRWTNPKYLATLMALCGIPVMVGTALTRNLYMFSEYSMAIMVSLMSIVLLAVVAKVVYGIITRNDNKAEI